MSQSVDLTFPPQPALAAPSFDSLREAVSRSLSVQDETAADDRPIREDILDLTRSRSLSLSSPGQGQGSKVRRTAYEAELSRQVAVTGMTFCLIMMDSCFNDLQRRSVCPITASLR